MAKPLPRSFAQAVGNFANGTDTPRDFLERCIAEIETREPQVKAFTAMRLDAARKAADASTKRWHKGAPLSYIDGMPIGIKDVIETADMPTQMGSELYEGWAPGFDSASVHALREAGAIILGKTVTTEFAATRPGPTCNPYDTTRTPGGSSSGSAAGVGCGMISAGLGTQVVGSILRPASYCGAYGYKPSLGGMNRGGSHDYMSQSVQGVIAASLADCWQVAIEIVQRTGGDPGHAGIIGPPLPPDADMPTTLAFLKTPGWDIANPQARVALETAIARLSDAGVALISADDDADVARIEKLLPESLALTRRINAWESRWPLNTYVDKDKSKLSESMVERLHEAEAMSVDDYRSDILRREEIRSAYASLANKVESCITLSAPDVAPVGLTSTGNPIFAVQGSLLGVPTLSLPLITLHGLPLGIQLLGFLDEDAALFAHAAAIETAIGPIESE